MGGSSKFATKPQMPHTAGNLPTVLTTSSDGSIIEPNHASLRYPPLESPTTATDTPPPYPGSRRNSVQYPVLPGNTSEHTGEGNGGDGRPRPGNASHKNSYDQQSAVTSVGTPDPHDHQRLSNDPRHADNRHENVGHPYGPSRQNQPSRELFSVDQTQEDQFADRGGGDGRPGGHNWSHSNNHERYSRDTQSGESGHSSGELPAREPLCVVCNKRPQYAKGHTRYPTCGLRCGDILKSQSGSRKICIICGIRPQHAPYPTCGLTCAAKLKESLDKDPGSSLGFSQGQQGQQVADLIDSNTYSACLMCWSATQQKSSEFCSTSCQKAAQDKGPILLEALRGHVTFKEISDLFKNTWKTSKPCPEVLRVYKIVENKSHAATYETFRNAHNSNEERRWHGISCDCDVSDPVGEDFCSSLECQLCQTVSYSFDIAKFKSGVHTSKTSSQSSMFSDDDDSTKTMLLTDVCLGNQISLARYEIPPEGVPDYDTIQIIEKSSSGKISQVDDVIVCKDKAIRPSYLVFYG